jgi:mannonate dehydratase
MVEGYGLTLEAIENFPPAHWDKILLGASGREEQIENIKKTITNMGRAGIGTMGMYDAITQYASQDKISYVHFRVRQQHLSSGPLIGR